MKARADMDVVWVPTGELAHEYGKTPRTIVRWATEGFLLTLGYRIRRDTTGHWLVGVSREEHAKFQRKIEARTS